MDENPQTTPPLTPQFADGSRVLCADGQTLGEVVATYREHLIVERGYFFPINFYVPYEAIAEAGGGDVVLSLNAREALAQGWNNPPADPIVPEAQAPVPPPAMEAPASTTTAPAPPAAVEPAAEAASQDTGVTTAAPLATVSTTEAPAVAAEEPVVAAEPVRPTEAVPDQASGAERTPQSEANVQMTSTTAVPTVPVEETAAVEEGVEVQAYQPDASVPPPAEPDAAGTVSLPPSFVGIPGRRLTDAELWSLLEPKNEPSESEEPGEQPEHTKTEKDTPDKPDT